MKDIMIKLKAVKPKQWAIICGIIIALLIIVNLRKKDATTSGVIYAGNDGNAQKEATSAVADSVTALQSSVQASTENTSKMFEGLVNYIDQQNTKTLTEISKSIEGTKQVDYTPAFNSVDSAISAVTSSQNNLVDFVQKQSIENTKQIDSIKTPVVSVISYGGADYNNTTKDVQQKMVSDTARLKTDSSFKQSEIDRAKTVIADKKSKGLDTKAQDDYLKKLTS